MQRRMKAEVLAKRAIERDEKNKEDRVEARGMMIEVCARVCMCALCRCVCSRYKIDTSSNSFHQELEFLIIIIKENHKHPQDAKHLLQIRYQNGLYFFRFASFIPSLEHSPPLSPHTLTRTLSSFCLSLLFYIY